MLKSIEYEIFPAHKNPTIVVILTFMNRMNTTAKSLKARKIVLFFSIFV